MLKIPFKTGTKTVDNNMNAIEQWANSLFSRFINVEDNTSTNVKLTDEGGVAIRLTNGTGATSIKGSLVACSTTADNQFVLQANEFDTVGAVYEGGIANGEPCWVVVSGRAQVLMKDGAAATRGGIIIAANTDGRALHIQNPGVGLPAVETHFKECGHFLESVNAGTNVLAFGILHFN